MFAGNRGDCAGNLQRQLKKEMAWADLWNMPVQTGQLIATQDVRSKVSDLMCIVVPVSNPTTPSIPSKKIC